MEKADIEKLALLARIHLREGEAEALAKDVSGILAYVSEINEIVGEQPKERKVGALHNVMRTDTNPRTPGTYTEDLLNAAPERDGAYVLVKRILKDNS